jgi:hypothetical protein
LLHTFWRVRYNMGVNVRLLLFPAALLVVSLALSCGDIAGLDDFNRGQQSASAGGTGGTGGNELSSASSGGGGTYESHCPDGKVEVAEVPTGWDGPYVIAQGADVTLLRPCDTGSAVELDDQLLAPPADCGCSCGVPLASRCEGSIVRYAQGDTGCMLTALYRDIVNTGCQTLALTPNTPLPFEWVIEPAPADICIAGALAPQISAATWGNHLRACDAEVQAVDELGCTEAPPEGFEPRLCVIRQGDDMPCPPGYNHRPEQVLYTGMIDTRSCSDDCSCDPIGVSCGGTLTIHATSCNTTPTLYDPDSCPGVVVSSETRTTYSPTVSGTCSPVAATSTGDVVGSDPFKLCCAQ